MKVRILKRPTGYVSFGGGPLNQWPDVDTVVDLPEAVAKDMVAAGNAEKVAIAKAQSVETRPAPTEDVEERKPHRPAAKDSGG